VEAEALASAGVANRDRLLQYLIDAVAKDDIKRQALAGMKPQGVRAAFKQPDPDETAHNFLWRAHRTVPLNGEVAIFNRSYSEDVLAVRVRDLAPKAVWQARFDKINAFETLLAPNGTRVLKFFVHITPDEQLVRFAKWLDDRARQRKISETDDSEWTFWPACTRACDEALPRCSTAEAPWQAMPSDHDLVDDLAVDRIIADHREEMGLKTPPVCVVLSGIRRRYHDRIRAGR
jgi:polyphosphate kinase 2 (PPK2 family)